MEVWKTHIPESLLSKYEIYNFNHAVEILSQAYTSEYTDIIAALETFSLTTSDLLAGGGNESTIPKKLSALLRQNEWQEVKITGDLLLSLEYRNPTGSTRQTIENFIGGHNIDYVKNRIAIEMEWNSKDQTFDRDLFAFRTFYEYDIISCGIIITRSVQLNPVFETLGIKAKYGASTTWMGKLLPRIHSGRHGGCPLMVVGITPNVITDWEGK